ncbi:MAG TPA: hypothetical protein PLP27_10925, partial [Crocinitomicaceae bacterium]|nr:hypothetical protein [Crocinitomicaceae bacterium]
MQTVKQILDNHPLEIQAKGRSLPLVSFGKNNKVANFVNENENAHKFGFTIKNDSSEDAFILIGGFLPTRNRTIFEDLSEILAKTGANCILSDGVIRSITEPGGSTFSGDVTVTSTDSKRSVTQLVRYACETPTRVTMMKLRSNRVTSADPESSNYNNKIKSQWFSALEDTVSEDLDLAPLQVGGTNFNRDMLDVNFQYQNHKFILSNENFNVIQVNAGTVLSVTMYVGAQLSTGQMLYRLTENADSVVVPT